jgi:hypothetical protein
VFLRGFFLVWGGGLTPKKNTAANRSRVTRRGEPVAKLADLFNHLHFDSFIQTTLIILSA